MKQQQTWERGVHFALADKVPDEGRGTLQHDRLQDGGQGQDNHPTRTEQVLLIKNL